MTDQSNLTSINSENVVVRSDPVGDDSCSASITISDTICGSAQESFFKTL